MEVRTMTQISIRVDDKVKEKATQACKELGIPLATAINIYLVKLGDECRIPFEVSKDPFYTENNLKHLRRGVAALNAGKGVEHECIKVD